MTAPVNPTKIGTTAPGIRATDFDFYVFHVCTFLILLSLFDGKSNNSEGPMGSNNE